MLLKDKMKNGQLYREFGHENIEDQEYEKEIERQRLNCKECSSIIIVILIIKKKNRIF